MSTGGGAAGQQLQEQKPPAPRNEYVENIGWGDSVLNLGDSGPLSGMSQQITQAPNVTQEQRRAALGHSELRAFLF